MFLLLTQCRARCDRHINNICRTAEIHGPPRVQLVERVRYRAVDEYFISINGELGVVTTQFVATLERRLATCEVATGFNESKTHTINN